MTLNKTKVASITFSIVKVLTMIAILFCYMGSTITIIANQGHNGIGVAALTIVGMLIFGWITFTIIKSKKPQVKEAIASLTGVWIYTAILVASVVIISVLTGLSF